MVILGYDTAINMGVINMRFSNSVDQIVDMSNKIEVYLKQRLRFFSLTYGRVFGYQFVNKKRKISEQ